METDGLFESESFLACHFREVRSSNAKHITSKSNTGKCLNMRRSLVERQDVLVVGDEKKVPSMIVLRDRYALTVYSMKYSPYSAILLVVRR